MAKGDNTYQNTKVQLPQGSDRLSIDDDGFFDFFGTTVTGSVLKKILYSNQVQQEIKTSALVMSTLNLPANGFVFLNLSVSVVNASMWLPSCVVGDELVIAVRNYALNSLNSVYISTSGCTIIGMEYSGVSNIGLNTSVASVGTQPVLSLKCFTDGAWTVVGASPKQLVTERTST
jgi:hypothetical protein